jgi:hypothetical protein
MSPSNWKEPKMSLKNTVLILGIALLSVATTYAENGIGFDRGKGTANPLKPAAEGRKGLFATEKLDMQQTIGMSFGTGANRFSQYYLNTMAFKISEPLTIQATLGIQNQTLGNNAFGSSGAGGARIIIPNIGVLYQPTKNLKIEFGFSNTPQYNYGYDPFWGRRSN